MVNEDSFGGAEAGSYGNGMYSKKKGYLKLDGRGERMTLSSQFSIIVILRARRLLEHKDYTGRGLEAG